MNNPKQLEIKLDRTVDGAPSQIPMLKFLTSQHPQVPLLGHDLGHRMKISVDVFHVF